MLTRSVPLPRRTPGVEQSRVHSLKDCQAILDVFKQHGHIELDTARMYGSGSSEEYLRDMGVEAQGFKVATKVFPSARMPNRPGDWTPYDHTTDGVQRAHRDSSKALGTDKVDLYYLHAPDREVKLEETLAAINDLHKAGHFERFGISNYKAEEVEQIISICSEKAYVKPSVYQGLYNSIARSAEKELIPMLRKHGLSYYCYNPLGGGFFTGAITAPDDEVEKGSRFDASKWQGASYRKRYYRDEYFKALKIVRAASEKAGLTMAEVALRWMQHHSALSTKEHGDAIIIGASSLKHIEANLVDFEKGPLPSEVVQAVDEAWKIVEPNAPPYHF